EVDVSKKVPASIEYFMTRFPRYRERLIEDLGITSQQVDELLESGRQYRELYDNGSYGYRLLQFGTAEDTPS
ncbi:MAG TPA: hypothetical protein VGQ76_05775, partial [Thermoanaerobaculia bacterium]|nr:hypothetical protein [Thermoanaerobaculia bacterium]